MMVTQEDKFSAEQRKLWQEQSESSTSTCTGSFACPSEEEGIKFSMPVKNTFVNFPDRPASLDDFYEPRRMLSAPAVIAYRAALARQNTQSSAGGGPPTLTMGSVIDQPGAQSTLLSLPESRSILRLAEVLPFDETRLDAASLQTVGSQGHDKGRCKPCAFMWSAEGCQNGADCNFCHLCEEGEKKRRKKEKRHRIAWRRLQQMLGSMHMIRSISSPVIGRSTSTTSPYTQR